MSECLLHFNLHHLRFILIYVLFEGVRCVWVPSVQFVRVLLPYFFHLLPFRYHLPRAQLHGSTSRAVVTSQNGWLKAWNRYCGIALDGEDWCDVRHGRLITIPDGIGNKKNIHWSCDIQVITQSTIRHVITCHSNAFASSAKYWITSSKFSFENSSLSRHAALSSEYHY